MLKASRKVTNSNDYDKSQLCQRISPNEIGSKARTGAIWSAIQVTMRNLIGISVSAILARLLAPSDYGLLGMVATLTAFLYVFSDMGLSWATIQRKDLTIIQASNLFWVNLVMGLFVWLICMAVSPLLALFYGQEELKHITIAMGACYFLIGMGNQHFALLQRSLKSKLVAKIEMASTLIAGIASVVAALAGYGYWSLVIQAVVGNLMRTILVWSRSGLEIVTPRRKVGTAGLIKFGGFLVLNGMLIYASRNLDSVLIGKFWGSEQLGYYDRAYFLMLLPSMLASSVFTSVMVPTLSAIQDDPARLGRAYRRALGLVAFASMPVGAGLATVAPEVVRILYGEQWMPVVPMLSWLSIACVTQPVYNTNGWLFTATGKAKYYLLLTGFNALTLSLCFLWAVQNGAVEVAKTYGLVMGIGLLWPALWLSHKVAGLRLRESMKTIIPVLVSILVMVIIVSYSQLVCEEYAIDWRNVFIIKVTVGVISYGIIAFLVMPASIRIEVSHFWCRLFILGHRRPQEE